MKTVSRVTLILGCIVLFASCSIFSKNKSEDTYRANYLTTDLSPAMNKSNGTMPSVNKGKGSLPVNNPINERLTLNNRASQLKMYVRNNGFSTGYCFLIDMSLPSGWKRFFVYDLAKNSIVLSGLVSHGNCNQNSLVEAKFSNTPSTGCSSIGKYRVGASYEGGYGKSYKLHGLESTNSNAYSRAVVLHGFGCVPDEEIYPATICNTQGCAGVSFNFLKRISTIIDQSEKPILLWIYK
jgi:hypothetical protein